MVPLRHWMGGAAIQVAPAASEAQAKNVSFQTFVQVDSE